MQILKEEVKVKKEKGCWDTYIKLFFFKGLQIRGKFTMPKWEQNLRAGKSVTKKILRMKWQRSRNCNSQCPLFAYSLGKAKKYLLLFYILRTRLTTKRFCCPPLSGDSIVLGVDKTLNFGNVHVTVTVQMSVCEETAEWRFPSFLWANFST